MPRQLKFPTLSIDLLTDSDLQNIFFDVQKNLHINDSALLFLSVDQIETLKMCPTTDDLITTFLSYFPQIDLTHGEHHDSMMDKRMMHEHMMHEHMMHEMISLSGKEFDGNNFYVVKLFLIERLVLSSVIQEIKNRAKSQEKTEMRDYSQSSTPQLDINRAISGDPRCFIKTIEPTKESSERKIIINIPDIEFINGFDVLHKVLRASTGLNFYVYYQGQIVPFVDMKPIDIIASSEIRKALNEQHKNLQEYYILDYAEWDKIEEKIHLADNSTPDGHLDDLDCWRERAHINVENIKEKIDDSILDILTSNMSDEKTILSVGRESDSLKATELLKKYNVSEKLVIANLYSGPHCQDNNVLNLR